MADTGGKESIALDVAERLGEFGARLTALEQSQHRDKQETNAQLREIRDVLSRMERSHNSGGSVELLLGRVLDRLEKPPPAPPNPIGDIGVVVAEAMKKRGGDPFAIIGYLMGGGALAWIVRGLIGV